MRDHGGMITQQRTQQTRFGWPALVRTSSLALAALLLCAALGFRDVEAAALASGVVVALWLLRYRTGLLGLLGLGALDIDVAGWMVPGALSNLVHRESWIATALPATLAVVSLSGLAAVSAALIGRRVALGDGKLPRAIGVAAIVLVAAANVAGAAAQSSDGSPIRPGDLGIVAQHVKFAPEALGAEAGRIGLTVGNLDLFWHTFTIKALDVNVNVPVQAERRITFTAEPGTYEFVCAIPGHAQAGMKGTLTVR